MVCPNGKSFKKLGEDDAGIASGSKQNTPCKPFQKIIDPLLLSILNGVSAAFHGHNHIGSRIPIRDREHIQGIHLFFMLF